MHWLTVFVLALFAFVPARADVFTSNQFRFAADFPDIVKESDPADSERDAAGNVISKIVMFSSGAPGRYFAAVAVDTYVVPAALNAAQALAAERDAYLREINATARNVTTRPFAGHAAMQFEFGTPNAAIAGRGLVVIIAKAQPVIYMLVTAYSPQVSAADRTAVERFYRSFRLTR
jgi:hypothetical protein